jgi:hypothetical protein
VRHATAVRRLRDIAERCQRVCDLWRPGTGLAAVYAFGECTEPESETGTVEVVQILLVVHTGEDTIPWCTRPTEFSGLPSVLELDKAPVDWFFWPVATPIGNHAVVGAVRIWDRDDGIDTDALDALAAGDPVRFRLPPPGPARRRQQASDDLDTALAHLRGIRDRYWQRTWRGDHHASGMGPEDHLWDAVHGYLDLLDAAATPPVETTGTPGGTDPPE